MSQLRKLSRESFRHGYARMNSRAFFASLSGVPLLIGVFYLAPENLMHTLLFKLCLGGVSLLIPAGGLLKIYGSRFLEFPRGVTYWRWTSNTLASLYGLCCSVGISYLLLRFPNSTYAIPISATLLFGCAVGASTFTFDFTGGAIFITSIVFPVLFVSIFEMEAGQGITLSYIVSYLFFLSLCRSVHLAEISVLLQQETIRDQATKLLESNEALSASNLLFQDTLGSIDQRFLLLSLDGVCYGSPSGTGAEMLGREPLGLSFVEILNLSSKTTREEALAWFQLLTSDRLDFKEISRRGPAEWRDPVKNLVYRLRYFPKRSEGRLSAVIMTFTDVTSTIRSEQAAEAAEARALLVLSVSESRVIFGKFLIHAAEFFSSLETWSGGELKIVRQELHNIKGTAGLFHVRQLAVDVDHFEMQLKTSGDSPEKLVELVRGQAREIGSRLLDWKKKEAKTLQRLRVFAPEEIAFSAQQVTLVNRYFQSLGQDTAQCDTLLSHLRAQSLEAALAGYEAHVANLARRLSKQVKFELATAPVHIMMLTEDYPLVLKSMVHIFNNAVDHGIEAPEGRKASGKSEVGTLSVSVAISFTEITIVVKDDGRGIDLQRLRAAVPTGREASESALLQQIFEAGVSTRQEATELSGQGIGLAALKEQIAKLGGRIEVATRASQGTTFTLRLPRSPSTIFVVEKSSDGLFGERAA